MLSERVQHEPVAAAVLRSKTGFTARRPFMPYNAMLDRQEAPVMAAMCAPDVLYATQTKTHYAPPSTAPASLSSTAACGLLPPVENARTRSMAAPSFPHHEQHVTEVVVSEAMASYPRRPIHPTATVPSAAVSVERKSGITSNNNTQKLSEEEEQRASEPAISENHHQFVYTRAKSAEEITRAGGFTTTSAFTWGVRARPFFYPQANSQPAELQSTSHRAFPDQTGSWVVTLPKRNAVAQDGSGTLRNVQNFVSTPHVHNFETTYKALHGTVAQPRPKLSRSVSSATDSNFRRQIQPLQLYASENMEKTVLSQSLLVQRRQLAQNPLLFDNPHAHKLRHL